ncbi:hypothetical protein HYPSUDRAFT_202304 [Hypholoma sublateritium FD-334 SS-4]|uniref:Uncharacterized protein n=1 Tax=Hypholoma sublateritium (strain FD-334 SS-4) TaxID=945553 RepID=A0A0D2PR03_HYPSF|nr:hypothetical protein HYPSUDRAFT_202304 [Hypholoma sublateritium FD-334 SS-4]
MSPAGPSLPSHTPSARARTPSMRLTTSTLRVSLPSPSTLRSLCNHAMTYIDQRPLPARTPSHLLRPCAELSRASRVCALCTERSPTRTSRDTAYSWATAPPAVLPDAVPTGSDGKRKRLVRVRVYLVFPCVSQLMMSHLDGRWANIDAARLSPRFVESCGSPIYEVGAAPCTGATHLNPISPRASRSARYVARRLRRLIPSHRFQAQARVSNVETLGAIRKRCRRAGPFWISVHASPCLVITFLPPALPVPPPGSWLVRLRSLRAPSARALTQAAMHHILMGDRAGRSASGRSTYRFFCGKIGLALGPLSTRPALHGKLRYVPLAESPVDRISPPYAGRRYVRSGRAMHRGGAPPPNINSATLGALHASRRRPDMQSRRALHAGGAPQPDVQAEPLPARCTKRATRYAVARHPTSVTRRSIEPAARCEDACVQRCPYTPCLPAGESHFPRSYMRPAACQLEEGLQRDFGPPRVMCQTNGAPSRVTCCIFFSGYVRDGAPSRRSRAGADTRVILCARALLRSAPYMQSAPHAGLVSTARCNIFSISPLDMIPILRTRICAPPHAALKEGLGPDLGPPRRCASGRRSSSNPSVLLQWTCAGCSPSRRRSRAGADICMVRCVRAV